MMSFLFWAAFAAGTFGVFKTWGPIAAAITAGALLFTGFIIPLGSILVMVGGPLLFAVSYRADKALKRLEDKLGGDGDDP